MYQVPFLHAQWAPWRSKPSSSISPSAKSIISPAARPSNTSSSPRKFAGRTASSCSNLGARSQTDRTDVAISPSRAAHLNRANSGALAKPPNDRRGGYANAPPLLAVHRFSQLAYSISAHPRQAPTHQHQPWLAAQHFTQPAGLPAGWQAEPLVEQIARHLASPCAAR